MILEFVALIKYIECIENIIMNNNAQINAYKRREDVSIVWIGNDIFGIRSVINLIFLAIKKDIKIIKKSKGTLMLQKIISLFFII